MVKLGIIGLGHWGPNYLRIFSDMEQVTVVACAELDPSKHLKFSPRYPHVRFTTNSADILNDPDIQAVVIATPTNTHHALALAALSSGKDVLVEKPLTIRSEDSLELTEFAKKHKRILMVGHTFLYNPAVLALREIIRKGELGRLYYFSAVRTNLGPIRQDVNALLDLAPHDISILLYLMEQMPTSISAAGAGYLNARNEDVVFLTLHFPQSVLAQIHVSWLEPVKARRLTVIGDRKMAVFNDIDVMEPIRIFDKGVTVSSRPYSSFQEFQTIIREGDVVIPKIPFSEPLQNECTMFIKALQERKPPLSDGLFGLRVVHVLEAAMESLRSGGQPIALKALEPLSR
jgi:predicted dehydrogenase